MRKGERGDRDREDCKVYSLRNCDTPEDRTISVCVSESPQRAPYRGSGGGRDWICDAPPRTHKEVKRQGRGGGRGGRSERGGGRSGREGGRVGRETDREEDTGQIVSEIKVCMSSSSSSETQDCREAAIRPRPPRPRPRPRSGPSSSTPQPHQTQSHTQTRPKQAYQTHTYLTECPTGPTKAHPTQNHHLEAQSDARQSQQTKTQDCRDGAISSIPRSDFITPHPHPPQTPAQAQHSQAQQTHTQPPQICPKQAHPAKTHTHPTQAQTQARQVLPTQAQNHKRQAPTHPTQAQTLQHHREGSVRSTFDCPPTHQTQTQQTQHRRESLTTEPTHSQESQAQTQQSEAQTQAWQIQDRRGSPITSDPPPTYQTQAQNHPRQQEAWQTMQHRRESLTSPRPDSDSPPSKAQNDQFQSQQHYRESLPRSRPTSASPPSHKTQIQDHTPYTRQTQQHRRESTTSPRPPSDSPPLQESHQAHIQAHSFQTESQGRQTQQHCRENTTSPSPRPTSNSTPSLESHPRAVNVSPASHQNTEPQRESPEERQTRTQTQMPHDVPEQQPGRPQCPEPRALQKDSNNTPQPEPTQNNASFPSFVDVPGPCEPEDLIDGIIFAANYLGSTQLLSDKNPSKGTRMAQAQEAVSQVKSQDEDSQMVTEVDLFISTKAVKVLNADTQETLMDSALRSISYIADIGSIVVLMARTRMAGTSSQDCTEADLSSSEGQRHYRMICYVFESEDAQLIAQSIGQAFSVAYREFLRANGINPKDLSQKQYSDIINSQEMYNDDLVHFSNSDNCKELELEKQKGESLGVVIVESGWGSILPTVILANMLNSGPAARSGKLNVGDQIMSINNTSLVGLPLATCQGIIKGLKSQVQVKLSIVSCPPVTTVLIKRPDLKFQLGFSVQNGIICSLMRGGIAERGGVRVGHRIIEINGQSVVAMPHEKIVQTLSVSVGEINMKTMPAVMFRLLTGQETPVYI
ncbi:amyloid-beta A4 precursor protein-binding family A member 1 isoform X2 [Oncorhynchus mykiss]|uniref:amyloid-beta A4 precursor protein-binding family A member 1 isoform X2 n=1 Tax=Oncorhynchus mykiss TaxID=8022 RepID=UPI0018784E0B|nr:amyloid-beta A4 precursor protein-binding family A member 1 isoform X2 [Oncorhynchus mykiss]